MNKDVEFSQETQKAIAEVQEIRYQHLTKKEREADTIIGNEIVSIKLIN